MGDLILSLPAIKSLKDNNNNNIEIDLLCSEKNYKILHNLQYIDNKIEINTRLGTKNLKIIRKKKYDLYINLSPTYLSYFLCFFSRSNKKATLIFTSRYSNFFFSKFFIRILSNIFCDHINLVQRYTRLKNNKEVHQTSMIFELLNKCNLKHSLNQEININLPNKKIKSRNNQKILTIHLHSKWINPYYSEEDFFKLLSLIPFKKFRCILTTDNNTKLKFKKIFEKYKVYNNENYEDFIENDEKIIIIENLNYKNWLNIIFSSSFIITPECGCTHIASAAKVPVSIIYDKDNLPEAIYKEYRPLFKNHHKFIFGDKNLNEELLSKL